jgi:uncharacterized protein (DUF58 family)
MFLPESSKVWRLRGSEFMTPTSKLLQAVTGILVLSLIPVVMPEWTATGFWLGVAGGVIVLGDAAGLLRMRGIHVERFLPARFAQGEAGEVRMMLKNHQKRAMTVDVFDGIPQGAQTQALPWAGELAGQSQLDLGYSLVLAERGEAAFGPVHVRRYSPLGLWSRISQHGATETVKVYPNYEPVVRLALLTLQNRSNPLGLARKASAGVSRDFHQLREYHDGDPLAQIDWKATSRRQSLISRDYQEQRNQSLVFLLDTGRRMRALDGGISQFDHVLNAILLVSYLALRQGDQVAVKSFGGEERWLAPVKGASAMPVLLNHLYDCHTTSEPSDFTKAVEQLMARQRRRSLVVLLTNLRGEDGQELVPALQVLQSKHQVLLASMRERVVDESLLEPVDSFQAALKFLAADRYLHERREVMLKLNACGVRTLDSNAQQFAVQLASRYREIKAAGRV